MEPPAVTSSTTVNVVPSMVRLFVQVTGANWMFWLPPHNGRAEAVPLVATASPAVTPASARAARPRLRPRRSRRALVLVAMKEPPRVRRRSGRQYPRGGPDHRMVGGSLSQQ